MSALRELQRGFQAGVLGDGDGVLARIAGSAQAPAQERLRVYADAMRLRFLEVLTADYPGVRALLGEAEFADLADAYARAQPSRRPSIRWFGAGLAGFLRDAGRFASRPQLAEMAAFEWSKGELCDAADDGVVAVDEVAAIAPQSWPRMRPRPVRALRRLDLEWNVPAIWSAIERGEPAVRPERVEPARAWLLWRKGLGIHWRSLDGDEAWAIDACRAGASFGELCVGLAERLGADAAPMRAAGLLKQWLTDGVIAAV